MSNRMLNCYRLGYLCCVVVCRISFSDIEFGELL